MAMSFNKIADGEWELNVCGYTCPHPQMYTKKALAKMASGDVLTVLFDNPSSGESIMAMCDSGGDELIERNEDGGSFAWKIRKA
jgi:tRNA 2-thiouridine synthesizing protein A